MTNKTKAYLGLHISIIFFGSTAVLGDLISLSAIPLVWWRLIIAIFSFIPIIYWRKIWQFAILKANFRELFLVGLFLALHWITFFGSVKLANASIGVLCLATTSFLTAFIEPVLMKRPFRWIEMIIGLMIIPGMLLVVQAVDTSKYLGIGVGLLSALFAAMFTTYNKKIVERGSTVLFTFAELVIAFFILSVFVALSPLWSNSLTFVPNQSSDWIYLSILAIVCTTICYTVAFAALRYMSAFTANLSINLEPVYGIILAWILLQENEEMGVSFYYGAFIILAVVLLFPMLESFLFKAKMKRTNVNRIP